MRIMKLKKAIENLLIMYMPEEKRHFEESSKMAIDHNIDVGENDHIYFSFYRLKIGLERGEFDD